MAESLGFLGSALAGFGGGSVGGAVVHLLLDDLPFNKGLSKAKAELGQSTGEMEGGLAKFAGAAKAGFAVAAVAAVGFAVKAVSAASDQNEALNKSQVIFGDTAKAVEEFSDTTAESFGISKTVALEAAAGFGNMLKTSGLAGKEVSKMSVNLVKLAADLASFNNLDPSETLEKLRSGLAGEAEPLRTVGILLSEARVKQEAYASGIAKVGSELTEGQKVQARYNLILKDSGDAQGDFARTSGGVANQQRILSARFADLTAKLGKELLPAGNLFLGFLIDVVDLAEPAIDALSALAGVVTELTGGVHVTPDQERYGQIWNDIRDSVAGGTMSLEEARVEINKLANDPNVKGGYIETLNAAVEKAAHDFQMAGLGAAGFGGNLGSLVDPLNQAGDATDGVRRTIHRFANLSAKDLREWKGQVREDLASASLTIEGLGDDWRHTARQTLAATRQMARDARTMATDLDKLADIKAPGVFKKWLIDQGPGWIHGYVAATETGRDQIEAAWRRASESTKKQKDALNEITTKVKGVGSAVNNLPDRKVIEVQLKVTATGDTGTVTDKAVADALARELVHAGSGG